MTPEQIALVRKSWAMILPISDTAAVMFYAKLFDLDPGLKTLFRSDMKEQGRKLMSALNTMVSSLGMIDDIVPAVQLLGRRHVDYGIKDKDYDTVGTVLLWMLENCLEDAFTPDVRAAWVETYTLVATTMKEAAKSAAA